MTAAAVLKGFRDRYVGHFSRKAPNSQSNDRYSGLEAPYACCVSHSRRMAAAHRKTYENVVLIWGRYCQVNVNVRQKPR